MSAPSVAAWCALLRPDMFQIGDDDERAVRRPAWPAPAAAEPSRHPHRAGARLDRPRKHYQWYYSTREANADMMHCPQGVHDFLRGYYHHKSADWAGNQPFRLAGWTATHLAQMPTYYIMDLHDDMPRPWRRKCRRRRRLPPAHGYRIMNFVFTAVNTLGSGFQGGLQWYRCRTQGYSGSELSIFTGRSIEVPSMFIAGASDWGIYQVPGAIERMKTTACSDMRGCHLLDGAGHWVQQEQPEIGCLCPAELFARLTH